jgi:hypothetical protein
MGPPVLLDPVGAQHRPSHPVIAAARGHIGLLPTPWLSSLASRRAAILATAATCERVNGGNVAANAAAHVLRSCPDDDRPVLRPERRRVRLPPALSHRRSDSLPRGSISPLACDVSRPSGGVPSVLAGRRWKHQPGCRRGAGRNALGHRRSRSISRRSRLCCSLAVRQGSAAHRDRRRDKGHHHVISPPGRLPAGEPP